jgi:hypothetical protein
MNRNWKISVLLAAMIAGGLFASPVMARRYGTTLYGYDRWVPQDYRYENRTIPKSAPAEPVDIARGKYIAETGGTIDVTQESNFDPVGDVLGVFGWIGKSVTSVFGG